MILRIILIFILTISETLSYRCDKIPTDLVVSEQMNSNNGKYLLEIADKPEKYVPNERYQITIKVAFYIYSNLKFTKFILSLESRPDPGDAEEISYQTGKFELGGDSLSKFSYMCPNTVIEANTQPKRQVVLTWVAPPPNSGCVTIKATVIETREKWYADDDSATDGYLTKTLCEDLEENEDSMPEILEECCACDEAKYEMAFQGNWIRNNHPKGFPEDLFTTKFSDIIGASHRNGHEFWKDGEEPSQGLKELAFNGSTRTLESELMDNIAKIHTIIKARGLSYPNITSSSYSIFRVDSKNHLVSMVTKITPSPDWIVGVSGLELCLSNCSWKQSRSINLYPRDVGIDDAFEYTGRDPSNNEHPIITEITSSDPADSRSPFFDETGDKMKPIAKLHFKLEKIYKKCDPNRGSSEVEKEEEISEEPQSQIPQSFIPSASQTQSRRGSQCETIGWSKWSSCSVQCGKGHMTKNVKFRREPPPGACEDIDRDETQECEAPCESGEREIHVCSNIVWSRWSQCSAKCGKGIKVRYRIPGDDEEENDRQCVNKEVVECEEDC